MSEIDERWPLAPSAGTDWLLELCGDGITGFMPPPLPDAAWVLHAMYEHGSGPQQRTYDEARRAALAEGRAQPREFLGIDLEIGVVTGGDLGRAEHPGPGWRRLRWAELSARTGDPVVAPGLPPCRRCFPGARRGGSWPVGVLPPAEGSLDRPTWDRLVEVLTAFSPLGAETPCLAYWNPLMLDVDLVNLRVRAGRLGDAKALYDAGEADFSPSNLWAADRSWVVCTDYDLWGTMVAGPPGLVAALLGDGELEAVRPVEDARWSPGG